MCDIDIETFEMFLAITRYGSINKAADALFLAQSTVTHRLKQLEHKLQTTLFVRTSSGVSLTPEGKRFVRVANSIVEQWKVFTEESGTQTTLTITAGKAFVAYELPRLLGAYRRENPNFTCYVKSTLYEESITALLNGTADLAVLGAEVYHPQIEQVFMSSDRILLIAAPDHPWAQGFPGWEYWGAQATITFGDGSAPFRQRNDRFLAEQGVFPNIIMELDSMAAVKAMVMQNLGVAMLPERVIRDEVAARKLVAHDIANGQLKRPTLLAFPKHKANDKNFQQFVTWISENY